MKGTARSLEATAERRDTGITLFVSYSHQNRTWMARLRTLLNGMQYDDRKESIVELNHVSCWHDNLLEAGDRWDHEIRDALSKMNIFVPLVSHDFFASKYIMTVEMKEAERRHGEGEIEVVPILLNDVNLQAKCGFLGQFSPLPAWGRPWTSYSPRDRANCCIDDGLWQAIKKVASRRGPNARS